MQERFEKGNMEIEKVCKELDEVVKRLYFANSSINIAKSVYAACEENKQDVFAPDIFFWHTVLDNCFYRALSELAKTYDESKDSAGLKRIINQVEQAKWKNPETQKRLVKSANEKYEETKVLGEKLRRLRDKGLMHTDKAYATNLKEFVDANRMPIPEMDHLIETAMEICNSFLGEFAGVQRDLFSPLNDDASGIISDLEIARELRKPRIISCPTSPT